MQASPQKLPPPGIVFDSAIGDSFDEVLALTALYAVAGTKQDERRASLAAVGVSRPGLDRAGFAEAMGRFYSGIADRDVPPRFRRSRALPVGLGDGAALPPAPLLAAALGRQDAEGKPLYSHDIRHVNDTAEAAALLRNAMTAYHDGNCIVVLAGPATNLARLLEVRGAKEIVQTKVRFLVAAIGDFDSPEPDPRAAADPAALRRAVAGWPTPIYFAGRDVGLAAPLTAPAIEKAFAWTPDHPAVDVFRAANPGPEGASTWALAATLFAVRPDGGYLQISEPGRAEADAAGRLRFRPDADGSHRRLTVDPADRADLLEAYVELAGAEPAPRELPDFLKRLIEEEKKKEDAEKAKPANPTAER